MTGPIIRHVKIGNCDLYQGDSAAILPLLGRVDAVVTDPPYGVTDHAWDVVVAPSNWMVAKGAIVTASEPYATQLIMSSPLQFQHDLVWVKNCASNHFNARKMPMRRHERILAFGDVAFNPIKRKRSALEISRLNATQRETMAFASFDSILEIESVNSRSSDRTTHPSQKPVALMEILTRVFTNSTDVILDPFMGSGTTGVACVNLGRSFIGIEKDADYFNIAVSRIQKAHEQADFFVEKPTFSAPVQERLFDV
ncbi:DNA-methyltransferase [Loktanella sp. R86503]|uniref:DNA-methyltransferase n=1 Tax=Loktanella sp. R86503 TaxID=3093847 RepID=UPI0036D9A1A8